MSTLHVENLKGLSSGGNANKIIVPSGQTIDASAGTLVPSAGAVRQVQANPNTAYTTFSTTSGVDALTCSITPSATTSNVLVLLNLNGITINNSQRYMVLELYRGSTLISRVHDITGYSISHTHYNTDASYNFLDTGVSTTSSTTYKLLAASSNADTSVAFNNYANTNNRTSSGIVLMEIAG